MPPSRPQFAFDPVAVGRSECAAWVAYYRRDWPRMLVGALGMVRHGFGLRPLGNLKAAWHVMRANQVWAPYPANDPVAAREHMARFYRMANKAGRLTVDPQIAAELEVAWWHVHRQQQHDAQYDEDALVAAYETTLVAEGKRQIEVDGKPFLLEAALRAQFALVHAFLADYLGNLSYALTARNFNPVMAMAADTVIVTAEHIVPVGVIAPDHVVTPAPLVDYLITNPNG
jgi:hypothetical protein